MKKHIIVALSIIFFSPTVIQAVDYIESSNGLGTPQMEGGRTEFEFADINGDGDIDILSIGDHGSPYINTQEHGVMVWFGDGQGNWSVYQNGNFGYGGIAIGDIDNDGYLDIGYGMHHNYSSTDFGDSIMEVALGDGSGQNWTPWDDGIATGGNWGMFCTDFADINNDGYLDIGGNSFGADDGVHLFVNHHDGTWTQCFGFSGGNSTMDFLFADVNADGNADFAAAHQYGSVYLGDGDGGFTLADGNLPSGGSLGRRGPTFGDIDNDGDMDFAFRTSDGGVAVWAWTGSNTWVNMSGSLPSSGPYYGIQLFDMNIDGHLDVAAFGDSVLTLWLGNGAGVWTEEVTLYTTYPGDCEAFRVGGDVDHNGYPDIVLVSDEGDWWTSINTPHCYIETSVPGSLFVFPIAPRGGETYVAGSTHFIDWTCGVPPGSTALLDLALSTSGPSGPWTSIIANIPNNGRYQWLIPTGISSNNCYIRYTEVTATDTSNAITSAAFRISPATSITESVVDHESDILTVCPTLVQRSLHIDFATRAEQNSSVAVYDRTGRLIKTLFTVYGSGSFHINWDLLDEKGYTVDAGVYFVTLISKDRMIAKKIVVVQD